MKNTLVLILILVVLIVLAWVVWGRNPAPEVPAADSSLEDKVFSGTEDSTEEITTQGSENKEAKPVSGVGESEPVSGTGTGVMGSPMPVPTEEGSGVSEMQVIREFTVEARNFSFTPKVITVKKGDLVKIHLNNTQGFHDLVIDEFAVATKQGNAPFQDAVEFTASKTGTFEFYCSVGNHRALGMVGTLKVEE